MNRAECTDDVLGRVQGGQVVGGVRILSPNPDALASLAADAAL
ncbi:MAG TPA: hypothetical protein VES01_03375 [Dermatophilaceae bacterium]|nr:hypothetical protein [Dermatophilaceae bacterium]